MQHVSMLIIIGKLLRPSDKNRKHFWKLHNIGFQIKKDSKCTTKKNLVKIYFEKINFSVFSYDNLILKKVRCIFIDIAQLLRPSEKNRKHFWKLHNIGFQIKKNQSLQLKNSRWKFGLKKRFSVFLQQK